MGKDLVWARTEADQALINQRVAALLSQPLGVEPAVQLALLNNRGLQAQFFALGIGEAELLQAGRLPNPGFSFARLRRGDEVELERGWHIGLARLLVMPLLQDLAAQDLAQTRLQVAAQVLTLAADTRAAWVQAVAAEESLRYARQVTAAAEASAELAQRMLAAGNFNKLQQAREQRFQAEAALRQAQAQRLQRSSRERLTRLLGLEGAQTGAQTGAQMAYRLPERLPDLPDLAAAADDLPDLERTALAQRLDVAGATLAVQQTARSLGLNQATRFINLLEVGAVANGASNAPTQRGWTLSLEVPLFDWGDARIARSQAVYMQAVNRAAQTATNARSEVREAYDNYRSAYDIARQHRDALVPLQQRISQENVLRYNGMLISVFELLADARVQIAGVSEAIGATRDFWLARADLDRALTGPANLGVATGPAGLPSAANAGAAAH
ncbi:MAG: RND transporter [Burkholderiales bacterium PBB5]|nr:MAG: RND transporter [Burkholderiales bacterium PBB5]